MSTSGWERADSTRRRKREQAELIALAESFYSDGAPSYCDSRNITGIPENHNRVVRASESSWERMQRLQWSECIAHRNGIATVFTRTRTRTARPDGLSDAEQKRAEQLNRRARVHSSAMAAHTELASGDC